MLGRTNQLESFRSNYFSLILMPTEACNFRCTYCYETFEHKKMSPRVVTGIKALIDRRADELDELNIEWFGGEPTLALDIVWDICHHARTIAKSKGFRFTSGMTTNGYLLDQERFQRCLENEIRTFQISLDGAPSEHNKSRVLASGAGTFDRIWSNLMAMKEVPGDFFILLRLHYTYENFISLGEFARSVGDVLKDDTRFNYWFHPINRLGGPNDENTTKMSDADKKEIEAHLWQTSGLCRSPEAPTDVDYICYAAKGNSLVVRSTGRLAKCTVALTQDFNDIGSINEYGELSIDQSRFRRWIRPTLEANWDIIACPVNWVAQQAANDMAYEPSVTSPAADLPVSPQTT
jgi:uncharacterized protein